MDDEEKEILYRVDERTASTDETVQRLDKRLTKHEDKLDKTHTLARGNKAKIDGGAFIGGAAITAVFTKLAGLAPW